MGEYVDDNERETVESLQEIFCLIFEKFISETIETFHPSLLGPGMYINLINNQIEYANVNFLLDILFTQFE